MSKLCPSPVSQGPGEIRGFLERAEYMLDIAEESLKDFVLPDKPGFKRLIKRDPLGVVFVIAPWKYASSASSSSRIQLFTLDAIM